MYTDTVKPVSIVNSHSTYLNHAMDSLRSLRRKGLLIKWKCNLLSTLDFLDNSTFEMNRLIL